jgi:hypothetical protein
VWLAVYAYEVSDSTVSTSPPLPTPLTLTIAAPTEPAASSACML